jgi:hypothetical protein
MLSGGTHDYGSNKLQPMSVRRAIREVLAGSNRLGFRTCYSRIASAERGACPDTHAISINIVNGRLQRRSRRRRSVRAPRENQSVFKYDYIRPEIKC